MWDWQPDQGVKLALKGGVAGEERGGSLLGSDVSSPAWLRAQLGAALGRKKQAGSGVGGARELLLLVWLLAVISVRWHRGLRITGVLSLF